MTSRVEISSDSGQGYNTRVAVDGYDFSNLITSLHLDVDASDEHLLTVSLVALPFSVALGETNVRVDDDTHNFLVRIGWTPPPEEAPK